MVIKDRMLRRWVPSTAVLSRRGIARPAFALLDLAGRSAMRAFTDRPIPPLRFIVRTGVGNSIAFPQFTYLTTSYGIWMSFLSRGLVTLDSSIVDIGSGAGKSAVGLRDFEYNGERFRGRYTGFDLDSEMVEWCRSAFPTDQFSFDVVDMHSEVYRPDVAANAAKPSLACPDGSVDLVFSQSLFSHLLEDDITHYIRESYRMLRPGGCMAMTFFCLEDLREQGLLGDRWTFRHRQGAAYIENPRFPEAAVAYEAEWIKDQARRAGFEEVAITLPNTHQSTLECRK